MGDEAYGGWNHLREEARHPTILGGGELTPVEGPRSSTRKGFVTWGRLVGG